MKHSLEERMDIGRRMYLHEITYKEAMEIYGLSESCAHKYMTDYKKAQGIPLANTGRTRSGGPRLCADRSGAKNSTPFCGRGGYTVDWTLKRRYGTRKSKRDEQERWIGC